MRRMRTDIKSISRSQRFRKVGSGLSFHLRKQQAFSLQWAMYGRQSATTKPVKEYCSKTSRSTRKQLETWPCYLYFSFFIAIYSPCDASKSNHEVQALLALHSSESPSSLFEKEMAWLSVPMAVQPFNCVVSQKRRTKVAVAGLSWYFIIPCISLSTFDSVCMQKCLWSHKVKDSDEFESFRNKIFLHNNHQWESSKVNLNGRPFQNDVIVKKCTFVTIPTIVRLCVRCTVTIANSSIRPDTDTSLQTFPENINLWFPILEISLIKPRHANKVTWIHWYICSDAQCEKRSNQCYFGRLEQRTFTRAFKYSGGLLFTCGCESWNRRNSLISFSMRKKRVVLCAAGIQCYKRVMVSVEVSAIYNLRSGVNT